MEQNLQFQVPVFRPGWEENTSDFAARCEETLHSWPSRTAGLPFRAGAVELAAALTGVRPR